MNVMDGKMLSRVIQEETQQEVERLRSITNQVPGLTVVIVGEDPASQIYVRSKNKMAAKLGIESDIIELEADISSDRLKKIIDQLNRDDSVDGILVQTPLPDHLDTWDILDSIAPGKDVDGFLPRNLGLILLDRTRIFPCTPYGIMRFLDYYKIEVKGMNAVVVGRSFIVGKPIASMLTNRHATVTVCHSRTRDLPQVVRGADLVVAAIGRAGFIEADWVKDGAVLIDVGINRISSEDEVAELGFEAHMKRFRKRGYAIVGDIHRGAYEKSSFYTPVPGGVGLMTVAMLMVNTVELFKQSRRID